HRPLAGGDRRDHSGLADALLEGDAELAELLGDHTRGAGLLEGQFGMLVQIDVDRFEVQGHSPSLRAGPRGAGADDELERELPGRGIGAGGIQLGSGADRPWRPSLHAAVSHTVVSVGSVAPSSGSLAAITRPSGRSAGAAPRFATTITSPLRNARMPRPGRSSHSSAPVPSAWARRSARSRR